jgi:hypothetical protein
MNETALEGRWSFDADISARYTMERSRASEEVFRLLRQVLSNITMEYEFAAGEWITRMPGVPDDTVSYRAVGAGIDWVKIEITSGERKGKKPTFFFYNGALALREEAEASGAALLLRRNDQERA